MGEDRTKDEQPQGFTVSDRRRRYLDDDGAEGTGGESARAPEAGGEQPRDEAGTKEPEPEPGQAPAAAPPEDEAAPAGPADFVQLVGKLYEEALVFMGFHDDPRAGHSLRNLQVASWHVDILGILREKTRGNLTAEEEKLLEEAVANLKVMFVRASGFIKR